jgi:8-oxo-dGTP pyrophosphatase MutT (NUDIX family)
MTVRVRALLITPDGGLLTIRRVRPGQDPYWVLPGGGVEDGETAEAAALRELREETTLTARIDRLLWTGQHNGRPASYYLVADVRGTPVLSGPEALDHSPRNSFELRWAGPGDLDVLNLHPPDIRHQLTQLLHGQTR